MPDRSWTRPAMATLLPTAMAAGTLFYALFAVLAPFVIDDLGISRAQLGLVGTAFSIVGALLSPVSGALADRLGARRAMLATFLCAGIGFLLIAFVPSFLALLAVSLILAFGQAMMNPGTNKMIAHEFGDGQHGFVTGIKQSGVQMGSFVAGVAFPAIALAAGWRRVPFLAGLVFVAVFALGLFVLPDHGAEPRRRAGQQTRWSELPPATWWTAVFALFMGLGGSPIFAFIPLYATESLGASEAAAGLLVGFPSIVGIASRIGWSMFADRRRRYAPTMLGLSLLSVAAGVLIVVSASAGLWLLWAATFLSYLSVSAWNSVAMLSVIVEAGPRLAGTGTGVVLFGFLVGLAVSPPIFGWSVDRLGTYTPGFVGVVVCFVLAAVTMGLRISSARRAEVAGLGA